MSSHERTNFIYVDTSTLVKECAIQIQKVPFISVDLEFDKNRYRYGFNLCLIQIYDGSNTYLIDPLVDEIDLQPIFEIFENPDIIKIVFSFGEDLRLLHSLGCFPKNLFDLQIAAQLLNFPPSSLANLIHRILEIHISKSSQQSNWFQRPLQVEQIEYAILDVIYLPLIYTQFKSELVRKDIISWMNQEMHHVESINHQEAEQNELLKEKYKADLTEIQWHVLTKLIHLRERKAKEINRPPYHISERKTLTEIAKFPEKRFNWATISSNHKSTKNSIFLEELNITVTSALEEASELGLSSRKRAAKRISKEEYQEWKSTEMKVKFAKQNFFKPIQKGIEKEYGEHVKIMILNNKIIREIILGNFHNILSYKKKIILHYAKVLDLDATLYFANGHKL